MVRSAYNVILFLLVECYREIQSLFLFHFFFNFRVANSMEDIEHHN